MFILVCACACLFVFVCLHAHFAILRNLLFCPLDPIDIIVSLADTLTKHFKCFHIYLSLFFTILRLFIFYAFVEIIKHVLPSRPHCPLGIASLFYIMLIGFLSFMCINFDILFSYKLTLNMLSRKSFDENKRNIMNYET